MAHPHPLDQLPVVSNFTLATLNTGTGILNAIALIVQNFKAVSFHGVIGLMGLTAGDGPLLYGISQGSLTLAEVTEYLTAAPDSKTQSPAEEQVSRPVQVLGGLGGTDKTTDFIRAKVILPHFREDTGFTFWIFNIGIQMTTGATIRVRGRFFGKWID